MPRLLEATKDVESCEKPRGTANRYRSGDVRMGKPSNLKSCYLNRSQRRELKHLSTCRKRKKQSIPGVVAIETGRAQTARGYGPRGVVGPVTKSMLGTGTVWKVSPQRVKGPYG